MARRLTTRAIGRIEAVLVGLVALAALSARADGGVVVPAGELDGAARSALDRIAAAVENGDYETLAAAMHPDGVRLNLAPQQDRASELTPAQAYYYFKNLFQVRRTIRFAYQKRQYSGDDRLLAVSAWRCERTDRGTVETRRLLFTLARTGADWWVTEIADLRGD
ncbi:MAG TPA: hypothetical protein PLL30_11215 [Candidatus Krumholzibacteria bacterium]|nr:hypothetical protein [Candidatus Krumholzibacteria bacterium]HPD72335.1 hypothetical protein [Candidatus Krumholzibacteria bacterium]HRY40733.1 hypothetical protein [Candidatus Krumholzibacteria bacterium]